MCGTEKKLCHKHCQSILRISFNGSCFNDCIKYLSSSPFSPTEIDLTPYCCYYCWWWWWRQYVKICENIKNLSKDKIEKDKTNFAKVTCWSVWRSVCRAMLALSCNLSIMRIVRRYKLSIKVNYNAMEDQIVLAFCGPGICVAFGRMIPM